MESPKGDGVVRTICIVGHWYCGSTLLSGLMNNVPGVASPGELQWIKDDQRTQCWVCRSRVDCELISGVYRSGLSDANLYKRAAEALGCDALVTSDKIPRTIKRFVSRGKADGILVFKRPEAFAASFKRHRSMDTVSSTFASFYPAALSWCRSHLKNFVVVEYEKLASEPEKSMNELCEKLGLEPPESIEYPPKTWHNIRGNMSSLGSKRYKKRPIILDERWRKELEPETIKDIQANDEVMGVWRRLRRLAK